MEASSSTADIGPQQPAHLFQFSDNQELKSAVFNIMERSRGQPPQTRSAKKLINELEERQKKPFTKYIKNCVYNFITEWLKTNEKRPKLILVGLKEKALRTPREESTKFKYRLSPELAKVLGKDGVLSGHVVIKMVRSIVNKECERDRRDFMKAIPCERLKPIFNTRKFKVDEIVSYLRPHLYPLDYE